MERGERCWLGRLREGRSAYRTPLPVVMTQGFRRSERIYVRLCAVRPTNRGTATRKGVGLEELIYIPALNLVRERRVMESEVDDQCINMEDNDPPPPKITDRTTLSTPSMV
ncbi:hypothetical protein TNIN_219401 [Trichonephila inaurata madagascariensis]|uniref:Uncharacterized protein n=1 Tax=Trichonephila inaurata madagascariensis TaxID=2747483 RepID=A0A8X6YTZ5_9ARAC|nr:hypothetical protein TNIN_219401 [Trichonephila inaurata madagascariensis]